MIPYTFEINDTSFASIVKKYSYSTDRIPVESQRITTMDGVDHVAIIRYKGVLKLEINPQDETTFNTFCDAVAAGVLLLAACVVTVLFFSSCIKHEQLPPGDAKENGTLACELRCASSRSMPFRSRYGC